MTEIAFDTETLGYIRLFEERTGRARQGLPRGGGQARLRGPPGRDPQGRGTRAASWSTGSRGSSRRRSWSSSPPTTRRPSSRTSSTPTRPKTVDLAPKGKGRHASVTVDPAWKARAIGKAGKNLKIARAVLMRHSDIVSVNVS